MSADEKEIRRHLNGIGNLATLAAILILAGAAILGSLNQGWPLWGVAAAWGAILLVLGFIACGMSKAPMRTDL